MYVLWWLDLWFYENLLKENWFKTTVNAINNTCEGPKRSVIGYVWTRADGFVMVILILGKVRSLHTIECFSVLQTYTSFVNINFFPESNIMLLSNWKLLFLGRINYYTMKAYNLLVSKTTGISHTDTFSLFI